jgi:glycosyltransferase involved in cell wall biosynthesis
MPVYNQEKYLAETIESVLGQTYKDFEFLILDDGSTDNSARIIREYARRDDRIVPYFEANSGRCEAANKLVARARGAWCAFLDADDVMLPFRLEKQLAFHQSNPEAAASSCHCYYINDQSAYMGQQQYPGLRVVADCQQAKAGFKSVHCAITALTVSKIAFLEVGGFRSEFWPSDDADFINRLVEKGFILIIIQDTFMKYRVHPSSVSSQGLWHMLDKLAYSDYCIVLRRSGQAEISFDAFLGIRQKEAWWIKLDRKKRFYSTFFYRKAGFSLYLKRYASFIWYLLAAATFSRRFVLAALLKKLRTVGERKRLARNNYR